MKGFDEDDVVQFIRERVAQEIADRYTDDELLYVADIIWDYYESKGLLSLTDLDGEDELLDVSDLKSYVKKELKRFPDEINIAEEHVSPIIDAELAYEQSLEDIF